ncbi:MAG TPA: fibrobacter succinogenes major paralogous domain-containing protein [Prolixibacteraceae bacterium]|nr:fibrobacter succinogenes major paralogous domain-containing protein [Prolixibacteraceae bacterium]
MKRAVFSVLLFAFVSEGMIAGAQAPEKVSYQSVIRDATGQLVCSETIGMKISILQGSAEGTAVYEETHTPATNANGLATLEVGMGTPVSGTFTSIDWGNGPFFLKVETDPEGGTNYSINGTSEILSVPYALHAKTANSLTYSSWLPSGNDLYFLGGNVGIGTETPGNKLDVKGGMRVYSDLTDAYLEISGLGGDWNYAGLFLTDYSTNKKWSLIHRNYESGINELDFNFFDGINYLNHLTLTPNGNMGIGVWHPDSKLDVNGTIDVNNYSIVNVAPPANDLDAVNKAYVDYKFKQLENSIVAGGFVEDWEGNRYTTVKIGSQTWMSENLKTTHYNDGSEIPLVTDESAWAELGTSAYCWYDNTQSPFGDLFGPLYNGYVVAAGTLCPVGWHVPTDAEWTTLTNYLISNGYNYDGSTSGVKVGKSMAISFGWQNSATEGAVGNTDYPAYRNKSGFSALPCGNRDQFGTFENIFTDGLWWSSDEESANGIYYFLNYDQVNFGRWNESKKYGFSVRCIKD